ncbi:MAG: hypothetical protein NUV34_03565 [Sulfuricaulis sp.]|nr:hypothetical protein [Sulfuricaulis sp.]
METADKPDQPKAVLQLDAARFQQADNVRETWAITVEQGVTRTDILNPAFWSHIAYKLRPYARIEVRCDDGSFFAELVVLNAERTWARVYVLSWADLTTKDVSQTQAGKAAQPAATAEPERAFRVEWKGPHKKFCVIRNSDNAYIRESEASKRDAEAWLLDYERVTS